MSILRGNGPLLHDALNILQEQAMPAILYGNCRQEGCAGELRLSQFVPFAPMLQAWS